MVDGVLASRYPVLSLVISRPVSKLTAAVWLLSLLTAPSFCPAVVKILSLIHVLLAYNFAPVIENSPIELWAIGGFAVVTVLHLLLSRKKIVVNSEIILYIALIALKLGGLYVAAQHVSGILAAYSFELLMGFGVIQVVLCCQRDPVKGSVLFGSFGAAALSVLLGQRWLLLLSYAYSASLLQGLAHALSREQATLLKLQDSDREKKIAHEWGHVVFFPSLLLHSIYTTLTSSRPKGA